MSALRRFFRPVAIVIVAMTMALAAASGWLLYRYDASGASVRLTTVIIPKGASGADIAAKLREAGVISDPWLFRLMARFGDRPIKAGEYAFAAGVPLAALLEQMREGRTVVRKLTLPEGLTAQQAAELVAAAEGLTGTMTVPAEGSLLPQTYHYSYGDGRDGILRRMTKAMDDTLEQLWQARDPDVPLKDKSQALVLASLVERETGVDGERARVAQVFLNRLKSGMRLQSDPTVVYAVSNGRGVLSRPLTRDDLQAPSPYNTYVQDGLPPGPIANPGRAALEAVLHPLPGDDLYFVADGTGGHVFARTLEEHNRNVAKWRQIERARVRP